MPISMVLAAVTLMGTGAGAIAISANASAEPAASPFPALSASAPTGRTDPSAPRRGDPSGDTGDAIDGGPGTRGIGSGASQPLSRSSERDLAVANANLAAQAATQAKQRSAALAQLARETQRKAERIDARQWVLPLAGYRLTAGFGETSMLWTTVHTGLDFAAPAGTPLVAVAAGKVTSTRFAGPYGNRTILKLADGTEVWYCHQTAFAVRPGREVRPGQLIGYVGSTGNSTGPHLHLEVHPGGGDAIDPVRALAKHGVRP